VLGSRAHIRQGASLTRTVLWDDVVVGDRASLHECIVGCGAQIPPGIRLQRKIILDAASYRGDLKGLEKMDRLILAAF